MTQDEIIRMARENCPYTKELFRGAYYDGFIKAAALVAAHEREKLRCAIILNDDGGTYSTHESKEQLEWMLNMSPAKEVIEAAVLAEREACAKVCETDELCCKCGDECAEAIRARGEK